MPRPQFRREPVPRSDNGLGRFALQWRLDLNTVYSYQREPAKSERLAGTLSIPGCSKWEYEAVAPGRSVKCPALQFGLHSISFQAYEAHPAHSHSHRRRLL